MNNPIIKDLASRYTCKKYDASKKVSPADLKTILEALRLSASSINSQPWKFIVIESDSAKERLHNTFSEKFQFNQPHIKASSHTILFAHKIQYTKADLNEIFNQIIAAGRLAEDQREGMLDAYMGFVNLNEDEKGEHAAWTKNQTYLAFGNALHTLARLGIDSTSMEGIDATRINQEFAKELGGYRCELALCIGYRDEAGDYNATMKKSRRSIEDIAVIL